jgi:protein O-GlcNAc transferase
MFFSLVLTRRHYAFLSFPVAWMVVGCMMVSAVPAHALLPLALKHYQAALVAEKANRLDQAEFELNQAITVDPNDPLTYIKLGNILEAQGRYERALAAYQTAAAHDAKDPTLYYSIGSLHEQLGQLPEARAAYEAALRKNGNYTFGLFPLGRVLARQGEDLKAISVYESFLTAYPNHVKAKRYLAGLYFGQKQPAKTVALLTVLKSQNPAGFTDYLLLAQAYNELKQPQQALNVLNEAKAKGLSMAALSQVAATAHEALGETEAATQDLEVSLTQDSDDVDTRLRLAQLYRTTGQPDKALAQVNQFLAAQPASINGRYVQANALLDLKRYDEAAQSLQRVAVLLPPDAPTSDRFLLDKQLAYALQQSGQPAKAVALYETWSNRAQRPRFNAQFGHRLPSTK